MEALNNEFDRKDNMLKTHTMRRLQSCMFDESEHLDVFIQHLRDLHKEAIEVRNDIADSTFREIILAAFPSAAFDTIRNILVNHFIHPIAASVIQQITYGYPCIENCPDAVVPIDHLAQAHVVTSHTSALLYLDRGVGKKGDSSVHIIRKKVFKL